MGAFPFRGGDELGIGERGDATTFRVGFLTAISSSSEEEEGEEEEARREAWGSRGAATLTSLSEASARTMLASVSGPSARKSAVLNTRAW